VSLGAASKDLLVGAFRPKSPTWRQRIALKLLDRDIQRLIVNIALILLIGTITHVTGGGKFFTIRNIDALVVQISVVTIIACAMTLVMVAGAIDISVPGIVVLSGVIAGLLIVQGIPMWLSFALATLTGVLVGLINSFLVIVVGITSLIATIGSLYVTQGVANLLTNGLPIVGLPLSFPEVGSGYVGGVPIPLPIMIGVVVVFVAIQKFTRFGRYTVATGSNPQAAFLNGVNIRRTLTICFVLSGAAAGWGGVMYASRIGNPAPVVDNDLLFQIIVAIVIGGTGLTGGQGSVLGTFFGAVLIGVVNQSLNLLGVSTFWQYIALGGLLVFSVGSDEIMRRSSVRDFRRRIFSAWKVRPGGDRGQSA
jgi:ribose/xylose/arabinose/galactoside ABC-type transport system permease subunit